ncbi:uncharacterized protein [Watersipora subatra]|uniref:uncharacterized protein n=1 Tax=Watersipora subatra TaxID=2589382 RepID=UPI00355C5143
MQSLASSHEGTSSPGQPTIVDNVPDHHVLKHMDSTSSLDGGHDDSTLENTDTVTTNPSILMEYGTKDSTSQDPENNAAVFVDSQMQGASHTSDKLADEFPANVDPTQMTVFTAPNQAGSFPVTNECTDVIVSSGLQTPTSLAHSIDMAASSPIDGQSDFLTNYTGSAEEQSRVTSGLQSLGEVTDVIVEDEIVMQCNKESDDNAIDRQDLDKEPKMNEESMFKERILKQECSLTEDKLDDTDVIHSKTQLHSLTVAGIVANVNSESDEVSSSHQIPPTTDKLAPNHPTANQENSAAIQLNKKGKRNRKKRKNKSRGIQSAPNTNGSQQMESSEQLASNNSVNKGNFKQKDEDTNLKDLLANRHPPPKIHSEEDTSQTSDSALVNSSLTCMNSTILLDGCPNAAVLHIDDDLTTQSALGEQVMLSSTFQKPDIATVSDSNVESSTNNHLQEANYPSHRLGDRFLDNDDLLQKSLHTASGASDPCSSTEECTKDASALEEKLLAPVNPFEMATQFPISMQSESLEDYTTEADEQPYIVFKLQTAGDTQRVPQEFENDVTSQRDNENLHLDKTSESPLMQSDAEVHSTLVTSLVRSISIDEQQVPSEDKVSSTVKELVPSFPFSAQKKLTEVEDTRTNGMNKLEQLENTELSFMPDSNRAYVEESSEHPICTHPISIDTLEPQTNYPDISSDTELSISSQEQPATYLIKQFTDNSKQRVDVPELSCSTCTTDQSQHTDSVGVANTLQQPGHGKPSDDSFTNPESLPDWQSQTEVLFTNQSAFTNPESVCYTQQQANVMAPSDYPSVDSELRMSSQSLPNSMPIDSSCQLFSPTLSMPMTSFPTPSSNISSHYSSDEFAEHQKVADNIKSLTVDSVNISKQNTDKQPNVQTASSLHAVSLENYMTGAALGMKPNEEVENVMTSGQEELFEPNGNEDCIQTVSQQPLAGQQMVEEKEENTETIRNLELSCNVDQPPASFYDMTETPSNFASVADLAVDDSNKQVMSSNHHTLTTVKDCPSTVLAINQEKLAVPKPGKKSKKHRKKGKRKNAPIESMPDSDNSQTEEAVDQRPLLNRRAHMDSFRSDIDSPNQSSGSLNGTSSQVQTLQSGQPEARVHLGELFLEGSVASSDQAEIYADDHQRTKIGSMSGEEMVTYVGDSTDMSVIPPTCLSSAPCTSSPCHSLTLSDQLRVSTGDPELAMALDNEEMIRVEEQQEEAVGWRYANEERRSREGSTHDLDSSTEELFGGQLVDDIADEEMTVRRRLPLGGDKPILPDALATDLDVDAAADQIDKPKPRKRCFTPRLVRCLAAMSFFLIFIVALFFLLSPRCCENSWYLKGLHGFRKKYTGLPPH